MVLHQRGLTENFLNCLKNRLDNLGNQEKRKLEKEKHGY